jgi:predicted RNA-binding protein
VASIWRWWGSVEKKRININPLYKRIRAQYMPSWLCIINRANFEIVKKGSIWGVSERHKKRLFLAIPGDLCAFYLKAELFEGIKKEPAIGGVFEVTSKPYQDRSQVFSCKRPANEVYPYRLRLKAIKIFEPELPFKPLIPKLNFITNKINYGGHIMGKAMRKIPDEDLNLII